MEITDNTFKILQLASVSSFQYNLFFKSDVGPDLKQLVFGYTASFNSRVSLRQYKYTGNSIDFHLHRACKQGYEPINRCQIKVWLNNSISLQIIMFPVEFAGASRTCGQFGYDLTNLF